MCFLLKKDYALSEIPEFSPCGGWENEVHDVFHLKTHFQTLLYPKHLGTLLNQTMASKKCKKPAQNPKSTQNKKIFPNSDMFL
jgi:hypothetical protein